MKKSDEFIEEIKIQSDEFIEDLKHHCMLIIEVNNNTPGFVRAHKIILAAIEDFQEQQKTHEDK